MKEVLSKTWVVEIPQDKKYMSKFPSVFGDTYGYDGVEGRILCGISREAVWFVPNGAPSTKYFGVPIAWLKESK